MGVEFFIVKSGSVIVLKNYEEDKIEFKNFFFGEKSIFMPEKRSFGVISAEDDT